MWKVGIILDLWKFEKPVSKYVLKCQQIHEIKIYTSMSDACFWMPATARSADTVLEPSEAAFER